MEVCSQEFLKWSYYKGLLNIVNNEMMPSGIFYKNNL